MIISFVLVTSIFVLVKILLGEIRCSLFLRWKVNQSVKCYVSLFLSEGPCLLHTTAGNLLRTLRGPGDCVRPRLLKLSRDGLVVVNYTDGTGHLAVFTINGRLLSDKKLDDQMLVCYRSYQKYYGGGNVWSLWFSHPGSYFKLLAYLTSNP